MITLIILSRSLVLHDRHVIIALDQRLGDAIAEEVNVLDAELCVYETSSVRGAPPRAAASAKYYLVEIGAEERVERLVVLSNLGEGPGIAVAVAAAAAAARALLLLRTWCAA